MFVRPSLIYYSYEVVGAVGFEPTTSCSQGRRANQAALRPDIDKDDLCRSAENGYLITGFPDIGKRFFNFPLTEMMGYANKCCFVAAAIIK